MRFRVRIVMAVIFGGTSNPPGPLDKIEIHDCNAVESSNMSLRRVPCDDTRRQSSTTGLAFLHTVSTRHPAEHQANLPPVLLDRRSSKPNSARIQHWIWRVGKLVTRCRCYIHERKSQLRHFGRTRIWLRRGDLADEARTQTRIDADRIAQQFPVSCAVL